MSTKAVAVYGKTVQEAFFPYLCRMLDRLWERGTGVDCEVAFAAFLTSRFGYRGKFRRLYGRAEGPAKDTALLLSIGGDGTFLDAVLYVRDSGIPILGINTGRLGFLANISVEETEEAVECICDGRYTTESRNLVRLQVENCDFPGFNYGLNEVSVHKTDVSSMLKIHAYIGETYLTTYWADGLIVATPTGSTAYSLSGGGPIVSPDCRNIILTPVCPHNLTMRSLVVPDDAVIRLKIEGRSGDFILSLDSRIERVKDICELVIAAGDFRINVVKLPGHNYYDTLRNKLGWGEDIRNRRPEEKN